MMSCRLADNGRMELSILNKAKNFIWFYKATRSIRSMSWIILLGLLRMPRLMFGPKIDHSVILRSIITNVCKKEIMLKTNFGTFCGNLAIVANIHPNYEPEVYSAILKNYEMNKNEKRIFINIGAHIGKYLVDLTKNFGYTSYGFEPTPSTFKYLKLNANLSGIDGKTMLFNFGLGNKNDTLEFYQSTDSGYNTFVKEERILNTETMEVPIRRFDDLDLHISEDEVKLILMDVEGFELYALQGMKRFIGRLLNAEIIVEVHENAKNKDAVMSLMKKLGYGAMSIDSGNWLFKRCGA